ncbi:MAG: PKD domain-containing protein [Halobacteriales archaeon]|nr:PKD domain-containing protein [Halobacteriales archaeon]
MRTLLAGLGLALLLAPLAHAQLGTGQQVDISGARFPPVILPDHVFYIDVDLRNQQGQEADVQLFATLYNMTGSNLPCDPQHANQPLSLFRKSVHLDARQALHIDGKAEMWRQQANGKQLDGFGEHEACVWSQWGSCPAGPVLACYTDTWSKKLTVRATNTAPEASARTDRERTTTGQAVTLTATARDPDGDALTTTWDLGDGARAEGLHVEHAYRAPGLYHVTFTASDGVDSTSRALSVIVDPPAAGGGARTPLPAPLVVLGLALAALLARRASR